MIPKCQQKVAKQARRLLHCPLRDPKPVYNFIQHLDITGRIALGTMGTGKQGEGEWALGNTGKVSGHWETEGRQEVPELGFLCVCVRVRARMRERECDWFSMCVNLGEVLWERPFL